MSHLNPGSTADAAFHAGEAFGAATAAFIVSPWGVLMLAAIVVVWAIRKSR